MDRGGLFWKFKIHKVGSAVSQWVKMSSTELFQTRNKPTCKKVPGILVTCFFKKGLVESWLDAVTEDHRKWNLDKLLLLGAWYGLLWVQTTLNQQTHLENKKGKAANIQKVDGLQAFYKCHSAPIFLQTESVVHMCLPSRPAPNTNKVVFSVYQQGGSANKSGLWKIGNNCTN